MSTPNTDIEKELSYVYLRAIAAIAGYTINFDEADFGIDGFFREVNVINGQIISSTRTLNFQAKSSIRCIVDNRHQIIRYSMDARAYNRLVMMNGPTPCLLTLFRLPRDKSLWVKFSEDVMELRHCCYWAIVKGTAVNPKSTKPIHIPQSQLLTPTSLKDLFAALKREEL